MGKQCGLFKKNNKLKLKEHREISSFNVELKKVAHNFRSDRKNVAFNFSQHGVSFWQYFRGCFLLVNYNFKV